MKVKLRARSLGQSSYWRIISSFVRKRNILPRAFNLEILINIGFTLILILIVDFLADQMPFIGAPPIYAGLGNEGYFICKGISVSYCDSLGYPIEFPNILGSAPLAVYSLFRTLKIPWIEASIFTQNTFLILGILGFRGVSRILFPKSSNVIIWMAVYLYFTSPVIFASSGLPQLMASFSMFPLVVFVFLRKYSKDWLGFLSVSSMSGLQLMCDPNAWVPCVSGLSVLSISLYLTSSTHFLGIKRNNFSKIIFLLIPGVIYGAIAQNLAGSRNPIEFIRGMGVDWATVFWPTTQESKSLFNNIFNLSGIKDIAEFSGDHSQIYGAYSGPVLLILASFGLFSLWKSKTEKVFAVIFTILIVFYAIAASGPSLKFLSTSSYQGQRALTYADYFLNSNQVVFDFPWAFIWNYQPFQSFRGTYRWWIGGIFLLTLLAIPTITHLRNLGYLQRNKRVLTSILTLTLMLGLSVSFPANPVEHFRSNQNARTMLLSAKKDLDYTYKDLGVFATKVLFLPSSGSDYLLTYIAPFSKVKTNNYDFDKMARIVLENRPFQVTKVYESFSNRLLDRKTLCNLFLTTEYDGIVLSGVDFRWDSYWWPPNEVLFKEKMDIATEAAENLLYDGFKVEKRPLAYFVKLKDKTSCEQ